MFDPNQAMQTGGGQDFLAMQAEVDRQRKLAALLRSQAMQQNADPVQGRMVGQGPGAQFVAPSIFQHLNQHIAPVLNSAWQNSIADKAEKEFDTQTDAQANQWRRALPRSVPGTPELAGPQAEGGSPELAGTPEVPVTREQILKYTLEGMRNPRLKNEAAFVGQNLTQDLNRSEDKTFRDEQARLAAAERREAQLEKLKAEERAVQARMENAALDRESREALARERQTLMMSIAQLAAQSRSEAAANRQVTKDGMLRQDSREFRQDVEALSRRTRDSIPMISAAQAVQELLDEYTDPKTGKVRNIPGIGLIEGALPNWALTTKQSTNAQKFQTLLNAIVRDQAGLSQTLAESDRVTVELMAKGKARQEQFVAAWPSIIGKLNAGIGAIEAGYDPSVVETFNKRGGGLAKIGPKAKPATASPLTPAEQAELKALEAEEAARTGSW